MLIKMIILLQCYAYGLKIYTFYELENGNNIVFVAWFILWSVKKDNIMLSD